MMHVHKSIQRSKDKIAKAFRKLNKDLSPLVNFI